MTWLPGPPPLADVARHEERGGLWRVLPPCARPLYLTLTVRQIGNRLAIVVDAGAELKDIIEDEHGQLAGSRWAPCDPDGDRV